MMRSSRSVLLSPPARWTTRRCWRGCGRTVSDPLLTQNGIGTGRAGRKQWKIHRANGGKKHKSESFRLRCVLFSAVRSAGFPLSPSSPARFFRVLGQKWVKHGALAPAPTASRRPSRRRRQQDRPRRPHHSCSPAEYR